MLNRIVQRRAGAPGYLSGAVGAGIVLVLLPSMTLVLGMDNFRRNPTIGYPVLAIFGIMILLGALALISTLFARLSLAAPAEALALPPGSIRATIALSLIVLFALLAVMLFQSLSGGEPVLFKGLGQEAKQQLVSDPGLVDVRVTPVACPAAAAAAAAASSASGAAPTVANAPSDPCVPGVAFKFDVQVGHAPTGPAVEFAKQLLTLIGTLMTSVVSFYFAAKSTEAAVGKVLNGITNIGTNPGGAKGAEDVDAGDHDHGGVISPTADKDLPQADGGVAPAADSTN